MFEAQLGQLQFFWRQVGHWLQQIGQQIAAFVMALLVPIGLMLGFSAQISGRNKAGDVISQNQAATLTYWVPPNRNYERVPQVEESDRRGAMAEWRKDIERQFSLGFNPTETTGLGSTILPGIMLQIAETPAWNYQTLLPDVKLKDWTGSEFL